MIEIIAKENNDISFINIPNMMSDITVSLYTSIYVFENITKTNLTNEISDMIKNVTLVDADDLKQFLNGKDLQDFCNTIISAFVDNKQIDYMYIDGFISYVALFLTQQVLGNILKWHNENPIYVSNVDAEDISKTIILNYIPSFVRIFGDKLRDDITKHFNVKEK